MSDEKNKEPRDNSKDTPRERPRRDDSRREIPPPKNRGGFIGESQKQQDSLRKAAEAPPRVPKKTKGSRDNDNGK